MKAIFNYHAYSVCDQIKAIKTIKRKITDLDKMKIEEQKRQSVRYDMDIIHPTLPPMGRGKSFCRFTKSE